MAACYCCCIPLVVSVHAFCSLGTSWDLEAPGADLPLGKQPLPFPMSNHQRWSIKPAMWFTRAGGWRFTCRRPSGGRATKIEGWSCGWCPQPSPASWSGKPTNHGDTSFLDKAMIPSLITPSDDHQPTWFTSSYRVSHGPRSIQHDSNGGPHVPFFFRVYDLRFKW